MASASPARMLVYSCSGCSNVAQLANRIAVRMDRTGVAEMSCIAGVGGEVPALLRKRNGKDCSDAEFDATYRRVLELVTTHAA